MEEIRSTRPETKPSCPSPSIPSLGLPQLRVTPTQDGGAARRGASLSYGCPPDPAGPCLPARRHSPATLRQLPMIWEAIRRGFSRVR